MRTTHHRIGNADPVWESRAVQRRPAIERWQPDLLGAVRATPWRNPAPAADEEPLEVLPPLPAGERIPAPERNETRRAVKRLYIRNEDLEQWGYTSSCGKCQKVRLGLPTKGMKHTSACIARVELAMAEENDPRWNPSTDRIARRLSDSVTIAEAEPAQAESLATPVLETQPAQVEPAATPVL